MATAPALLETQRRFLAALYDDAEAGPVASITGNGLGSAARLRIYRHSCNAIQTGALRTAYPAVLALVGEAFFEQAARGYRAAYPSHAGNLQAFGAQFAEYIGELPAVHTLAYLPDVARLEWLRQETALDGDVIARSACARTWSATPTDPQNETILRPSVRLLASVHAVLTLWRYAMQPTPERLELPPTGERVMLWREEEQVAMAALDPASFACIESLARGSGLVDAYEAGRKQDPDFDFAACTETLVDRGLLVTRAAFNSPQETPLCRSSQP